MEGLSKNELATIAVLGRILNDDAEISGEQNTLELTYLMKSVITLRHQYMLSQLIQTLNRLSDCKTFCENDGIGILNKWILSYYSSPKTPSMEDLKPHVKALLKVTDSLVGPEQWRRYGYLRETLVRIVKTFQSNNVIKTRGTLLLRRLDDALGIQQIVNNENLNKANKRKPSSSHIKPEKSNKKSRSIPFSNLSTPGKVLTYQPKTLNIESNTMKNDETENVQMDKDLVEEGFTLLPPARQSKKKIKDSDVIVLDGDDNIKEKGNNSQRKDIKQTIQPLESTLKQKNDQYKKVDIPTLPTITPFRSEEDKMDTFNENMEENGEIIKENEEIKEENEEEGEIISKNTENVISTNTTVHSIVSNEDNSKKRADESPSKDRKMNQDVSSTDQSLNDIVPKENENSKNATEPKQSIDYTTALTALTDSPEKAESKSNSVTFNTEISKMDVNPKMQEHIEERSIEHDLSVYKDSSESNEAQSKGKSLLNSLESKQKRNGHKMHYANRNPCRLCSRLGSRKCIKCGRCPKCAGRESCDGKDVEEESTDKQLSPEARNKQVLGSVMDRALFQAFRDGNFDSIMSLIDNGMDINFQRHQSDESTALMAAALHGKEDIAKDLLKRGADPSITDKSGNAAWRFASKKGYMQLSRMLWNAIEMKSHDSIKK